MAVVIVVRPIAVEDVIIYVKCESSMLQHISIDVVHTVVVKSCSSMPRPSLREFSSLSDLRDVSP